MARLSFNAITPVNPFKELSDTTGNAANYFFGQAQALREAEQQELSNRLAEQRLAEDRRINDSTIAARNFELKTAQEAKADKQRIKDVITNTTKNADKHIQNYAFNENQEYVNVAGKSISDAFRALGKRRGLSETAPAITAKEGTQEYQNQVAAKDSWSTKLAEVSKEFDAKVRPVIQSTFLDKKVVDRSTAKSALMKHLLAQNVPVEQAISTAEVLSSGYVDYGDANKAARDAYSEAAKLHTDLVGSVAKGFSKSNKSNKSKTFGPSAVKLIEGAGATISKGLSGIFDSSRIPLQAAVQTLIERDYSPKQANEIVAEAGKQSIKNNGNIDNDRFKETLELIVSKTPIETPGGGTTAHNKPILESINRLTNKAIAYSDAAMSTGLHTKVLQGKLKALQQFVNKQSQGTSPANNKRTVVKPVHNRRAVNPQTTAISRSSPINTNNPTPRGTTPIGDGTVESLAMNALQNPSTQKDLRDFLQLRTAATNEKDPTKAIQLHNQVQQASNRFNGVSDMSTEQLTRTLDRVNQYRSEGSGSVQLPHSQMQQQVDIANREIQNTQQELAKAQQAYQTTGLPQFKVQAEELIKYLKGLQDHKQLWGGFLKGSNASFLDSISNN